jgi:hypothetical protein
VNQSYYPNGGVVPISDSASLKLFLTDEEYSPDNWLVLISMDWDKDHPAPPVRHSMIDYEVFGMKGDLPNHAILNLTGTLQGDFRFLGEYSISGLSDLLTKFVLEYFQAHPEIMATDELHPFNVMASPKHFTDRLKALVSELGEWDSIKDGTDGTWDFIRDGVYVVHSPDGYRKASKHHYHSHDINTWTIDTYRNQGTPETYPTVVVYTPPKVNSWHPDVTFIPGAVLLPVLSKEEPVSQKEAYTGFELTEDNFMVFYRRVCKGENVPVNSGINGGLIVTHGDKCSAYESRWNKAGLTFSQGIAIYLLTFTDPWQKEVRGTPNGWVPPGEWVAGNADRFLPYFT